MKTREEMIEQYGEDEGRDEVGYADATMDAEIRDTIHSLIRECSTLRRFLVIQGYGETPFARRFTASIAQAKEIMGIPLDPPEAEALP